MLEHPALWIGPPSPPTGPTRWLIREAEGRRLLGLARHRPGRSWWRWLAWPVLEFREGDDEALVFTLDRYRGLQTTWIVRDAEERLVGKLRGHAAWDDADRVLARSAEGGRRWLNRGQLLATLLPDQDGILLTFHGDNNPFPRMLLLAAAAVFLDR